MKSGFMAVILGCDENAYGFAKVLNRNYGIVPISLTTTVLEVCKYTKILDVIVDKKLHEKDHLIEVLEDLGVKLKKEYEKLIIIPCSDLYLEIITKWQSRLTAYENCFIGYDALKSFNDKKSFYELCDKYGLPYPKTITVTPGDYKDLVKTCKFDFPLILKPNNSNSYEYLHASFDEKEKVYVIKDRDELLSKIEAIYNSSYQKELLIQEFVNGDDSHMRVLNVYSDRNGKVKVMSLCEPILEEYHPSTFGNYAAIISIEGTIPLMDKIKAFLEDIKFVGAANFDIKIDEKTGKYYLFEINPRPGRSSLVTDYAHASIQDAYVRDLIYNDLESHIGNEKEVLWLNVPMYIVKKYVKKRNILEKVKKLKKKGEVYHTLRYKKDNSLKRFFIVGLQYARKIHYFPKYFIEKK